MVAKNETPAQDENAIPEEVATELGGTVVNAPVDGFSEEELSADAFKLLEMAGGVQEIPSIANVLGNGFGVLTDKMTLVNRPFVIVRYGVHASENGEFATIHCVTTDGEKWIVNDGSTGIAAQLKQIHENLGRVAPLRVPRGLRVSEYDVEIKGQKQKAKTFYLNTSN